MPSYNHLKYKNCSGAGKPFELVFHNVSRPEVNLHTHDFMEIFLMQEGRCLHIVNGEEIELAPNDFGFAIPDDLHGYRWIDGRSYRIVNLAFPPGCMRRILERHSIEGDPFWGAKADRKRIRRLTADDGTWMEGKFRDLRSGPQSELALEHFLLSLMLRISPSSDGPFDKCPSWLRDACVLMVKPENFSQGPRRFEKLSGRTLPHVSRMLRQSTGKTPIELVTELRMKYAAEKLLSSSAPIHEISADCGFASLGRFYSVFTSWHGTSPRRYRMRSSHAFPAGK
ncbi:MAG: hypothetical protein A2X45_17310 [Lentisphaerae bacterium GWF2_50_93]|nr:MAG: hypothetical protein A2X45_17310 [Lentisphaerae bacterium GWF2_50_93]